MDVSLRDFDERLRSYLKNAPWRDVVHSIIGAVVRGFEKMSLIDRISDDIKSAMKAKDKLRLETVRSVKKTLLEKVVEARVKGNGELSPEEELAALSQLAKQRRDSIAQYLDAGRPELADKEQQELEILQEYLPTQLSLEEVEAIVDKIIAQVGATSPRDMGKVMGPAMQELKGKADGKLVQDAVKQRLAG